MKPKFKINDTVTHPSDLYGLTESVITKIERVFTHPNTCSIMESELRSIRKDINPRIEGDYLITDGIKNEKGIWVLKPKKRKFSGFVIHTKNNKINSIWNESALTLKKQ